MNGTILKELFDGDYSTETIIGQYKLPHRRNESYSRGAQHQTHCGPRMLFRAAVILSEQQRRGPEGHATTINYKGFLSLP